MLRDNQIRPRRERRGGECQIFIDSKLNVCLTPN